MSQGLISGMDELINDAPGIATRSFACISQHEQIVLVTWPAVHLALSHGTCIDTVMAALHSSISKHSDFNWNVGS